MGYLEARFLLMSLPELLISSVLLVSILGVKFNIRRHGLGYFILIALLAVPGASSVKIIPIVAWTAVSVFVMGVILKYYSKNTRLSEVISATLVIFLLIYLVQLLFYYFYLFFSDGITFRIESREFVYLGAFSNLALPFTYILLKRPVLIVHRKVSAAIAGFDEENKKIR